MCLIAFAIRSSARWPLVVAANRDEYLNRPSAPLARWRSPGGADIVSGRDLRAGGAWFGVTPQGRVAFLTNVRELNAPDVPRSRGELVTRRPSFVVPPFVAVDFFDTPLAPADDPDELRVLIVPCSLTSHCRSGLMVCE